MSPEEKKAVARVWKAINRQPTFVAHTYFEESGGSWELFSRTFGWFQVSREFTDEQKSEVERLFRDQAEAVFGTRDGVR